MLILEVPVCLVDMGGWNGRTGHGKKTYIFYYFSFKTLVCKFFIYQAVSGPSITYSSWFECSFLQPHEGYELFGFSFSLQVFIAKDRAWPHLPVLLLQPHSTTVCRMTVRFLLSFCLISHSGFGYKTEATYNCSVVQSGNLFPQPQLEFTELNKQLSVKRFLHIETLALLYQLTILLPTAANVHKWVRTLFPQ